MARVALDHVGDGITYVLSIRTVKCNLSVSATPVSAANRPVVITRLVAPRRYVWYRVSVLARGLRRGRYQYSV